jgi:uncharacterized protein YcbK (DUF882 family)
MEEKDIRMPAPAPMSRRRFIVLGSAALAMPLLSRLPALASASPEPLPPDRELSFFNIHTHESLSTEYCRSGCLDPSSLEKIDYILRDDRVGEIKKIDVRLLDLLLILRRKIAAENPYHVISGYRSPKTNEYLRVHGHGVAEHSLHLLGQAIDIRVPGVRLQDLYRTAVSLRLGGVGFYPGSDFVHVDVGRIRTW